MAAQGLSNQSLSTAHGEHLQSARWDPPGRDSSASGGDSGVGGGAVCSHPAPASTSSRRSVRAPSSRKNGRACKCVVPPLGLPCGTKNGRCYDAWRDATSLQIQKAFIIQTRSGLPHPNATVTRHKPWRKDELKSHLCFGHKPAAARLAQQPRRHVEHLRRQQPRPRRQLPLL